MITNHCLYARDLQKPIVKLGSGSASTMADKYKGHLGMDVWRRDKKRYDESFGPLSTTAEIEVAIQKLYSSVLWYYPVHKYIGDIVQR